MGAQTSPGREADHRTARSTPRAAQEEALGPLILGRLSSMADALDELRGLEQRDAELSAFAGRRQALDAEVALGRERAEAIEEFFRVYPGNENRLRKGVAGAQSALDQ